MVQYIRYLYDYCTPGYLYFHRSKRICEGGISALCIRIVRIYSIYMHVYISTYINVYMCVRVFLTSVSIERRAKLRGHCVYICLMGMYVCKSLAFKMAPIARPRTACALGLGGSSPLWLFRYQQYQAENKDGLSPVTLLCVIYSRVVYALCQ